MNRSLVSVLAALAVTLIATTAPAITHIWQGGFPFDPDGMNTASNWTGGVPVDGSSNLTLIFPNTGNPQPDQDITTTLDLQSMQVTGSYNMQGNGYAFRNLGAAPSLNVNGGLQFDTPVTVIDPTIASVTSGVINFNNVLAGSGNLTLTGSSFSNFFISGPGSNTYTGTLTVNGSLQGTLSKSGGPAIQGDLVINGANANVSTSATNQLGANTDLTVTNNGYFQAYFGANQTLRDITANNGGQVIFNNSTFTVTGTMSNTSGFGAISTNSADVLNLAGGLRIVNVQTTGPFEGLSIPGRLTNGRINKTGPGILYMQNNTNSFTGQNIISAGTLVGNADSIGSDMLNNGTLVLQGGNLNSAIISGSGNVVVQGFVSYNAAQSYTGGTTVDNAFSYADGDSSTLLGSFTSTNNGTLRFQQAANGTFTGAMSGNLLVEKFGAGVLTLGGVNTHSLVTDLIGGGLSLSTDTALGSSTLRVSPGSDPRSIDAVGTRTFSNPLELNASLSVVGGGDFNFTNTAQKNLNSNLIHNSTGNTTIAGKFVLGPSGSVVVNSGMLELGNASLVGGFTSSGAVVVNGGTLKVNSLNFTTLPDVTLASGTLDAPNGYAIPLGAALQGTGNVTGRVATANGSTIIATGPMGIGDPSHPAGVNFDGELYTNQYLVSLSDSNQAVLGSLTDLGTATQNGTLTAGNGFVLNFGRNIVGRGQIQSNNLLADAAIINGDVNGDSFSNYLEFTGYVKGVGTFNNVAFSGTFSPGLSPTLMTVGNVIYTPSNVLTMELGGLLRGGQYDAFDVTGTMVLGGALDIDLINAFSPALGDQFLLFQPILSGSVVGAFSSFNFPALNPGLAWDTSLLYSNGILQVVTAVPEPAMLSLALLGGLLWRRRRT